MNGSQNNFYFNYRAYSAALVRYRLQKNASTPMMTAIMIMETRMMIMNYFFISSLCFEEMSLLAAGIFNFLRIQFVIFSFGMNSPLATQALNFKTISTFGGIINVQVGTYTRKWRMLIVFQSFCNDTPSKTLITMFDESNAFPVYLQAACTSSIRIATLASICLGNSTI